MFLGIFKYCLRGDHKSCPKDIVPKSPGMELIGDCAVCVCECHRGEGAKKPFYSSKESDPIYWQKEINRALSRDGSW